MKEICPIRRRCWLHLARKVCRGSCLEVAWKGRWSADNLPILSSSVPPTTNHRRKLTCPFHFLTSQFLICKVGLMMPRVVGKLKQITEVEV